MSKGKSVKTRECQKEKPKSDKYRKEQISVLMNTAHRDARLYPASIAQFSYRNG